MLTVVLFWYRKDSTDFLLRGNKLRERLNIWVKGLAKDVAAMRMNQSGMPSNHGRRVYGIKYQDCRRLTNAVTVYITCRCTQSAA